MTTEWKELSNLPEVAAALIAGYEIEVQLDPGNEKYCPWKEWNQNIWSSTYLYRARARPPAMKKVKSLCWLRKDTGQVYWRGEWSDDDNSGMYVRFPAGDIEGEVEA